MDRIERHDVLNAAFLAVAIMSLALGLLYSAQAIAGAVTGDEAAEVSSSADGSDDADGAGGDGGATGSTTTTAAPVTTTTTEAVETTTTTAASVLHPPNEVITRVGNGARRGGIAGLGTTIMQQAGYQTLAPKNADTIERSVVYYQPGYDLDAAAIATLMTVGEDNVLPMPGDPGVPINEAHIVIILGQDTTFVG